MEVEDASCTVTVEGAAVKKTVLILGAQVSLGSISIDQIEARVSTYLDGEGAAAAMALRLNAPARVLRAWTRILMLMDSISISIYRDGTMRIEL